EELEKEPHAEEEVRRKVERPDEDNEPPDAPHSRAGIQMRVGAEDAGDGSGRADRGHLGARSKRDLRAGRDKAAEKVKAEITAAAHAVFDVVAEDPEEPHVADDVRPARVHEHRAEDAERPRDSLDQVDRLALQRDRPRADAADEPRGNEAVLEDGT